MLPQEVEGPGLEVALAQHLLVAADRFQLPRLRRICERRLCETVEVRSAALDDVSSLMICSAAPCPWFCQGKPSFAPSAELRSVRNVVGSQGLYCETRRLNTLSLTTQMKMWLETRPSLITTVLLCRSRRWQPPWHWASRTTQRS